MDVATDTAAQRKVKSTITCDLEGIIETYNVGAEQLFGYAPEEVIGRKRVSLFSPGWIVLQNVGTWLGKARDDGEFHTRTVFIRKDGSRFNAEIRLTPTFREGKQIGYCGVTTPIEETVQPERKWWTSLVS
jgi:PAS domain S-box-containing protein